MKENLVLQIFCELAHDFSWRQRHSDDDILLIWRFFPH